MDVVQYLTKKELNGFSKKLDNVLKPDESGNERSSRTIEISLELIASMPSKKVDA